MPGTITSDVLFVPVSFFWSFWFQSDKPFYYLCMHVSLIDMLLLWYLDQEDCTKYLGYCRLYASINVWLVIKALTCYLMHFLE